MNGVASNPLNWSWYAAVNRIIGLDIAAFKDHCAMVRIGMWRTATGSTTIGVVDIKQWDVGEPLDNVAEQVVALAQQFGCRIVADASNNAGMLNLIAGRLSNAPNQLIATQITSAAEHAAAPSATPLAFSGKQIFIARYGVSKSALISELSVSLEHHSLHIAQTGDWQVLQRELDDNEAKARASGSMAYSAPSGKTDDVVMALALGLWGVQRLGGQAVGRRHVRKPMPGVAAWT